MCISCFLGLCLKTTCSWLTVYVERRSLFTNWIIYLNCFLSYNIDIKLKYKRHHLGTGLIFFNLDVDFGPGSIVTLEIGIKYFLYIFSQSMCYEMD